MYLECRHLFPSGKKCESPALKGLDFCYFHRSRRNRALPEPQSGKPAARVHHLPPLEDTDPILSALSGVLEALAANQIDPRRAQILIYGLQVASQHSWRLTPNASLEPVREAFEDETGALIGPRQQALDREDIQLDDQEEDEDDEVTEEERRAYFDRPWETDIQAVADSEPESKTKRCRNTRRASKCCHPERSAAGAESKDLRSATIATTKGCPTSRRDVGEQQPGQKKKGRSTGLQAGESDSQTRGALAPAHIPNPPLKPDQFRTYAQKQILKTFGDRWKVATNPQIPYTG